MFTIILWAIAVYFAYRFIVGFLLPVFKVTRQMRGQVRAFQEEAARQQQQYYQTHTSTNTSYSTSNQQPQQKPAASEKEGDYIDFEEIK